MSNTGIIRNKYNADLRSCSPSAWLLVFGPFSVAFRPCFLASISLFVVLLARADEPVDFNRDVRPILSDKCYHCHGPDASNQESEFRLDSSKSATADLGGYAGVVPGKPDDSELVLRIESEDEDAVMPPPDAPRSLNAAEKAILRRWIAEGANYDQHWSFKRPQKPDVPEGVNPIDYLVRQRLPNHGLSPSGRASKRQLIRRVTLDLTGLPPTQQEVQAFLDDETPGAYDTVVDRLLASPAYGERMAQVWLDAARYADSAGYQNDFKRSQWPWRDWVVAAYNRNLPFDRFSIEQLAGDLLPAADDQTRLATAFNRNHRINNEGGIIPAEFLVEYVADRVETTSTVWLGLTVGCSRCHDHKYDPITMKDYYSLFAFFHNIPEKGKDGALAPAPNMNVYTGGTKQEHEQLRGAVTTLQKEKSEYAKSHAGDFEVWRNVREEELADQIRITRPDAHYAFEFPVGKTFSNLIASKERARIRGRENQVKLGQPGKFGDAVSFSNAGYIQLANPGRKRGFSTDEPFSWSFFVKPQRNAIGDVVSCQSKDNRRHGYRISLVGGEDEDGLAVSFALSANKQSTGGLDVRTPVVLKRGSKDFTHVCVTYDGTRRAEGVRIYLDGDVVETQTIEDDLEAAYAIEDEHRLGGGLSFTVVDELQLYRGRVLSAEQAAVLAISDASTVALLSEEPSSSQEDFLQKHYFENEDEGHRALATKLTRAQKQLTVFERDNLTQVSIMEEMAEPRETHLLVRGAYDHPDTSETLSPATFSSLPAMDESLPRNRLGLARWLFQEDHPLTSRVAVNRYWQMLFGAGLVKTPEDFGSQGASPSHPKLLDHLAVEFRESAWNVKAMLKRLVTSETYCQDSRVTPEMLEADPTNRWLARGPRFRLNSFAIRDQALAASGLLVRDRGGPPVMPYQPAGLWEEVSAKGFKYVVAKDAGLYRRSLYTFWRRTVPPPNMMNFDSAGREACSVNVQRTNTPLQAMNLMNDPQFVEAARALGRRVYQAGDTAEERIAMCSQWLLARPPSVAEMNVFRSGYEAYLAEFRDKPEAASAFLGKSSEKDDGAPAELAACAAIASVFLNLDETVTKE